MTLGLIGVLPARTASAHDAPAIAPTRLEFDASQAPKSCNDRATFNALLLNWVAENVWIPDADRRLVVRIHRSPRGEKLVEVTFVDATGATTAEWHKRFGAREECHRVLYESASAAARLLGAFEEPPPPEQCPEYPPPRPPPEPPPSEPAPSPACAPCPKCPVSTLPPAVRRFDLGVGALFGMGARPAQWLGPQVSFGFVPWIRVPHLRIEIDVAYASPTSNAFRGDMIPLFGSLCYAPSPLRLCGGLVTTFFVGEPDDSDTMHTTLAASMLLGTEFRIAGPVSLRADAFALMPFWRRTFGHALAALDAQHSLAAGGLVTSVWSFK